MAIFCVTYDLNSPGQKYSRIYEYLKQFTHCKDLDSFWLIDTQKSASSIRDALKKLVDNNDQIFVARLEGSWAASKFGCGSWLKESTRNW